MSQIPIQGRGSSSETSFSMGEFTHPERQKYAKNQVPTWDNTAGLSFNVMLIYVGINKHGAKLYADPLNKIAVKMEDIHSPFARMVLVNYQGDQYVSRNGTRYVQTDHYEHMDAFGWIQPGIESHQPSPPTMPHQSFEAEVGSNSSEHLIYDMPVNRIYVDNLNVVIYENPGNVIYKAINKGGYDCPPETFLHVYQQKGSQKLNFYDNWGNVYSIVRDHNDIRHHTWQGKQIFPARPKHTQNHTANPEPQKPRMSVSNSWEKHLRPTYLQKFSKKFDGTGDPYDHVAQFRQLIFAEGVKDVHTMVQGFGLTLMGKALTWFQTLKPAMLYDFETLAKHFIESYTKIGIKHNTVTQILSFQQKDNETIKECIDRLRQYIVRCPASETPSQERLISCFLEGLRNRQLYMHLFAKNHADFDECCFDAQKFDDNCDLLHHKPNQDLTESGESSKNMKTHALVDLILQKLRQELNLIQPSHMYDTRVRHQGQTKWCEFCINMDQS